jgi:glycosyltransferase involved in cell wall biosynthesis
VGSSALYLARIAALKRVLRQSGCEVVVANTCQAFWAVDAASEANLPAIWIIRESEPWEHYFDYVPPDIRRRCYEAFAYAYRVVFVANATLNGWRPLESRHNYTLIRNGLDRSRIDAFLTQSSREELRRRHGIGDAEIVVLLMGTVTERKRQLDLVRAVGAIPEDVVRKARFFIVGDRPSGYSDTVRQEWMQLPEAKRERVMVVPETYQPFEYFGFADVSVCSSEFESYPRVILEAMAFGLPIITTPVWGIREQTQENINALYYHPGDIPNLSVALTRIITEGNLRSRLADNAHAVLDSLPNFDDMLRSYGQIISEARLTR